jgi:hypothetical protein
MEREPGAVPVDWDHFFMPPGSRRRLVVQPAFCLRLRNCVVAARDTRRRRYERQGAHFT